MLQSKNLTVGYKGHSVLEDISFDLQPGTLSVMLGANGSGKTTLIKTLGRLLAPLHGEVVLDDIPLQNYHRKTLARRISYLPQIRYTPSLAVETLIAQGRYPHHGYFSALGEKDADAIDEAMRISNTWTFRNRQLLSLSGGERQRVYLAMLLAQDAEILLLDEPTAFLDIAQQLDILDLLRRLTQQGKTILAILHDIPLALRYADTIFLLHHGRLLEPCASDDLLHNDHLQEVFDVNLHYARTDNGLLTGFTAKKQGGT